MFITAVNQASKKGKTRFIMIAMKSLSSDHERISFKDKTSPKKEILAFDPFVQSMSVYQELKKIRTMRGSFVCKEDYNLPKFNDKGEMLDPLKKRKIPKISESEINKTF